MYRRSSVRAMRFTARTLCASPAATVKLQTPESEQKIKELAMAYSQLTLKEINQLQREVFKQLGHSDDFYEQALLRGMGGGGGGGVVMAAVAPGAPAAASNAEADAKAEEEAKAAAEKKAAEKKAAAKTAFDINLASYPPDSKVKAIKALRDVTKVAIAEGKAAIDKAPGIIAKSLGKEDAEKLKKLLEEIGCKVDIL